MDGTAPLDAPHGAIDETNRRIVIATQGGLPLTPRPYHAVAERLGLDPEDVMARISHMQAAGIIRRIGPVPNHYRLGYTANGMSVWDVPDAEVAALGPRIGALPFVSHCYRRPRHHPVWPYNLFAMVHGRSRDEVAAKVCEIADLVGDADRGHAILYSTRILKKTGLRLGAGKE